MGRFRIAVMILLCLLATQAVSKDTLTYNVFHRTLENHGALWHQAIQVDDYNWCVLLPVAAVAGAAIVWDPWFNSHLKHWGSFPVSSSVSNTVTYMGDPRFLAGSAILLYGSGWLFDDFRLRQTAVMASEAFVHAAVISTVAKVAFSRRRPYIDGYDRWLFPVRGVPAIPVRGRDYLAFPSAHATGAFTLATVLAKQYSHKKWLPPVAYSLAGLASLSRTTLQEHWLSDVIAGAALGYGIGQFVVKRNKYSRITLMPTSWDNSVMLTMHIKL